MTESIITALEAALVNTPDDISIRLHVGRLLGEQGELAKAAEHFEHVLKLDPANIEALQGAFDYALESGQDDKAAGYQKLLTALGAATNPMTGQTGADNKANNNVSAFPGSGSGVSSNSNSEFQDNEPQKLHVVETGENVTVGPWEDFEAPVTLADVGGMQDVKKRLHLSFLAPLKNPELMKSFGKRLNGGLMLYGPPGCGKTFIARALAGELGAKFMSIGISDVLDMYIGESERKLHEIFEAARRNAPAVVFFDEVDAIGQKRSQLKNSGMRHTVNQFLAEMDSVDNDNKNVFVLSATNHPWDVDTALRRPGRFDRLVLVLPPDLDARRHILEYHLKDRPVQDLNLEAIAQKTDFFSGADLAHLCESAIEYALEDSIETGTARPVTMQDFERALKEVKPSTRPWFETARNYAMFANEGGAYDDLLQFIQQAKL